MVVNGDPEKMKLVDEIFAECSKISSIGDPCEVGADLGYCMVSKGAERNIMFAL